MSLNSLFNCCLLLSEFDEGHFQYFFNIIKIAGAGHDGGFLYSQTSEVRGKISGVQGELYETLFKKRNEVK